MGTSRIDTKLAEVASLNHGLVSARLTRSVGVDARMLRRRAATGRLEIVYPGVFRVAGCPDTWRQRVAAAVLAGRADTAASHRTACVLWGLRGFHEGLVEVLSTRWRRLQELGINAHESKSFQDADICQRDGITTLSIERTLLLVGAFAPESVVEAALDDAIRQGLTSETAVADRFGRLAKSGRNGIGPMRAILAVRNEIRGLTRSSFEAAVIATLVEAGLPSPIRNQSISLANGKRVELDLAYPDYGLFIELDSEGYHLDLDAFYKDRWKQNQMVLLGMTPLRFTFRQHRDRPGEIVSETRRALKLAGWVSTPVILRAENDPKTVVYNAKTSGFG